MIVSELVQLASGRRAWLIANSEKAPCDANGYRLKGWNTEAALRTYAQAKAAVKRPVRFVGLRTDAVPDLAALDLDHVLNDAGGHIDPIAAAIWGHWPSYTEVTPSGRGLRIWWRVEPQGGPVTVQTRDNCELAVYDPATGQLKPQPMRFGRELYYRAVRFLIVTERPYQWYPDAPCSLATITPGDLADIARMVRDKRAVAPTRAPSVVEPAPAVGEPAPVAPASPAARGRQAARAKKSTLRYIEGMLKWVAAQREGNRNSATFWAACKLRDQHIPQADAAGLLVPIAKELGLPEREAERTIASAYRGRRGA